VATVMFGLAHCGQQEEETQRLAIGGQHAALYAEQARFDQPRNRAQKGDHDSDGRGLGCFVSSRSSAPESSTVTRGPMKSRVSSLCADAAAWYRGQRSRQRLDMVKNPYTLCAECPEHEDKLRTWTGNPIPSVYFNSLNHRPDTSLLCRRKLQGYSRQRLFCHMHRGQFRRIAQGIYGLALVPVLFP
jgi:hypothetical protein